MAQWGEKLTRIRNIPCDRHTSSSSFRQISGVRGEEEKRIPRQKNQQFAINVLYMLLLLAVLLLLWLKALITFLFFRCELFTREQIIIWWNISGRRLLRVNNKKIEPHKSTSIFIRILNLFSSCSHEIVLFSSQFFNPAKHSLRGNFQSLSHFGQRRNEF